MRENSMVRQERRSTMFAASVAPLVNTTSAAPAPTSAATCSRAVSTSARARRPSVCTDDGLPEQSSADSNAARASGRSGAVAL